MVSDFFLNVSSRLTDTYGFSAEQGITLLMVFFAVGIAVYFAKSLQNRDIGVVLFFFVLILGVFMQIISFLVVVLPLILTALFYFYKGKDE